MTAKTHIAEIKGIGFPNKGAELLLIAILEQLKKRGIKGCIEPKSNYDYRVEYPLYTKTRVAFKGVNLLFLFNFLPKFVRKRIGLVRGSELDIVLDASGYAYGDPWGSDLAKNRILSEKFDCPVVFLPQTFGPFENAESQDVIKKLYKKSNLIFAREPEASKDLFKVLETNIPVIPDITFGLEVTLSANDHGVIIIPNHQVLAREGKAYTDRLEMIAKMALSAKRKVTFLNHEGVKDEQICFDVISKVSGLDIENNYISPKSGLAAKEEISGSSFVFTSRYHGLISSLSTCTPCIPLGWSHKYDSAMSLMKIDGYEKNLTDEAISHLFLSKEYSEQFSSEGYKKQLIACKSEVEEMWALIFEKLDV